jgi:NTE family protein
LMDKDGLANRSKTALVLAGGGITGAVYHIGALRAIDDLLVDRCVNDFDIFVGTSSGSLVASLLAVGYSPEEMLLTLSGADTGIRPLQRKDIFTSNGLDLLKWGFRLPQQALQAGFQFVQNMRETTLIDLLWSFSEAFPTGLYDSLGLERYIRRILEDSACKNKFEKVERDLFVIATDLDSGERVIFGKGFNTRIPISLAVAASSALPIFYKPVRIGDREYVDGGLRGTASLDLAIECGADLVVCINPIVPYNNQNDRARAGKSGRSHLSQRGIRSVADQTLRIMSHSGLEYHLKQLRRRHPDVDIILIEPHPDDYAMFFNNMMQYSARLTVARHGFESVTLDLAEDYPGLKSILERHGIPISRRLVIEELAEIQQSDYNPQVIQRILEARSTGCDHKKRSWPHCQLDRTLAELEMLIDNL